jgi:hypothetical protein
MRPTFGVVVACPATKINGAIAQLGERYNGIVEVSGSIPLSSTKLFNCLMHRIKFLMMDERSYLTLFLKQLLNKVTGCMQCSAFLHMRNYNSDHLNRGT